MGRKRYSRVACKLIFPQVARALLYTGLVKKIRDFSGQHLWYSCSVCSNLNYSIFNTKWKKSTQLRSRCSPFAKKVEFYYALYLKCSIPLITNAAIARKIAAHPMPNIISPYVTMNPASIPMATPTIIRKRIYIFLPLDC